MRILFFSILLTGVSFAIHFLVWKIAIPRRQTRSLLLLFAAVPCAAAALSWFAGDDLPAWWPATAWECLQVAIFHTAVALAYVVVYSALEERSPSMTLLSHVWRNGGSGCTRRQLEAVLCRLSPVEVRLAAMVRDGMIAEDDGVFRITAKGCRWIMTFDAVRRLLGFSRGG